MPTRSELDRADAAGDRIAEHVDEGRKLGIENGEFADALDAAAGRLASERSNVRARVGDVESDSTTAATFTVGDTWLVDLRTLESPIDAKIRGSRISPLGCEHTRTRSTPRCAGSTPRSPSSPP